VGLKTRYVAHSLNRRDRVWSCSGIGIISLVEQGYRQRVLFKGYWVRGHRDNKIPRQWDFTLRSSHFISLLSPCSLRCLSPPLFLSRPPSPSQFPYLSPCPWALFPCRLPSRPWSLPCPWARLRAAWAGGS